MADKKPIDLYREYVRDMRRREDAERIRQEFDAQHDAHQATHLYGEESDLARPRSVFVRPPSIKFAGRLRTYVSCAEPEMYQFAEDAKHKARHAYLRGLRSWTHEYTIDIVNVKIRIRGRVCLIEITPIDAFYFEFASSANPIKRDLIVGGGGGFSFERYNGVIVGVDVRMMDNAMSVTPRINKQRRTPNGADASLIQRAYMVDLYNEPVAYRNPVHRFGRTRYPDTLMESWAPNNPHTGIHTRGLGLLPGAGVSEMRLPLATHTLRDIDFDVPFERNHNKDPIQDAYIRINADWPRANGVQVVKHDKYGSREFAIYVDAFNQFHVFPTAAIEPLSATNPYDQNVATKYVQRLVPVFPAWCFVQSQMLSTFWAADPSGTGAYVDLPEPDWQFHPEGTRAASIIYERVPYVYDTPKFTTGDGATAPKPFTQADFDTFAAGLGVQGRHQVTLAGGYHEQRYFVAPGVIEVTIQITLTGDLLENYTAEIFVREVRRPTTTPYCALYVGYIWYDVPFGAKVVKDDKGNIIKDERIAKIGQFVAYDVERWTSGTTLANAKISRIMSVKDLDTGVELFTCPAGPLFGIDVKSLSFVMQTWNATTTKREMPRKFGDPAGTSKNADWRTFQFGMWVVIGGKPKEILWPATMPDDAKRYVTDLGLMTIGPLTWRQKQNTLAFDDPTWHLVALNDPTDWTTGNWGLYRDAYLQNVMQSIGGSHPYPPDAPAIERTLEADYWSYYIGLHVFYTATPKWGWYTYADEICNCVANGGDSTFYVHPSGTWAFWNNQNVYIPKGQPTNGDGDVVDYLPGFDEDVKTIEHVIFDRVHFEMRNDHRVLGHHDTTFLKLYNKAVEKGQKEKTLEDGIETIGDADLRATFDKDIYPYAQSPFPDLQFLKLKATWDGRSYWFLETGIQGGPYYLMSNPSPQQGGMVGLTFNVPWSDNSDYFAGNFIFPALQDPHIRFCNPIVIQTVNA